MIIQGLCVLNFTFVLQHFVTFTYTKRLNRFYEFPTVLHVTDLILAASSAFIVDWFKHNIQNNVFSDLDAVEHEYRIMANLEDHIDFRFEYLFSVCITCLILRVAVILQFNESIGPLIKIVGKLAMDICNFSVVYIILIVMFAIVGNMNFLTDVKEFEGLFKSLITVIDASLGNYQFTIF